MLPLLLLLLLTLQLLLLKLLLLVSNSGCNIKQKAGGHPPAFCV
jgi:hypothetical protein